MMVYEIVGWVWGVAILWCIWEFLNTPCYPADFTNREVRRKAKRSKR